MKFDSCAAVCSVPKLVPGLTWCACLLERHQASSSCVAMAARWCAARVRAFRRRRSRLSLAAPRSSAAPRRRAADAVAAARRHAARARRPGISLRLGPWAASAVGSKKRRGQQDPCKWVCEAPQPGSPSELARLVQVAALTMDRARRCLCDHEITLKAKAPAPNTSVRDTLGIFVLQILCPTRPALDAPH